MHVGASGLAFSLIAVSVDIAKVAHSSNVVPGIAPRTPI